ncbi:MAG: two component transcriptional regulator, AraC family [Paenibacillus sp.]|nr:two component transcriptional regulator, AraC family [Paenibacillus sp.]
MSYRIAIVDDEEDIREGLADLVDWSGLGYTVVARLEDGRDAISFIQSHSVDVILTDIKMTFVSGLELAKYVYDHRYNIKMILISGYKEFEFAQQALNYQVAHYLLKPTRLSEVHQVFRDVKAVLDKEKSEKELSLDIQSRNEEMLSMLRRQFFAELTAGTLADREEIGRRLQFIRIPVDPEISPCCLYSIRIPHDGPYPERIAADHDANRLLRFIQHAYRHEQDYIQHIPLRSEAGIIRMAAIDLRGGFSDIAYVEEKVVIHFETVKGKIYAVLGKNAGLEDIQSYARLLDLVPATRSASEPESVLNDPQSPEPEPEPARFDPLVIQKAKSTSAGCSKNRRDATSPIM